MPMRINLTQVIPNWIREGDAPIYLGGGFYPDLLVYQIHT